eukprot:5769405-Pyramimonas_sp.AAC.1
MALKKLRSSLQKEVGLTTFMDRDGGRLLARWEPLAKVVPHPGTRVPSVAWNPAALAEHGISKEKAQQIVQATFLEKTVEWCG